MALARLEWFARIFALNPETTTGFRCHRSAMDSIADLFSALENAKETKTVAYVVRLDIRKAFDCLPHEAILDCRPPMRTFGQNARLLEAFLRWRQLRVRVSGTTSSAPPRHRRSSPRQCSISLPL
ncbi:hypothetical protein HPB48_026941 [Haemaphysalis longicornis]|uniref:Reverse transcriptase domain-containing protein n=1 Tax=Haemaphysalis longicornis TaxID=44386 RepID=A0A9J6H2J2_HAELO|nr:hypothetical protein HPB48_026941 [Haemaphysalis longicornis]